MGLLHHQPTSSKLKVIIVDTEVPQQLNYFKTTPFYGKPYTFELIMIAVNEYRVRRIQDNDIVRKYKETKNTMAWPCMER